MVSVQPSCLYFYYYYSSDILQVGPIIHWFAEILILLLFCINSTYDFIQILKASKHDNGLLASPDTEIYDVLVNQLTLFKIFPLQK